MAKRRYLDGNYDSLEAAVMDWQRMAPVATQLRHSVGRTVASNLTWHCRACGEAMVDRDLRGRVEELDLNVLSLFALGVCRECRCITPFEFLIRELDGEIVVQPLARAGEADKVGDADYEPGMRALLASLQRFTLD